MIVKPGWISSKPPNGSLIDWSHPLSAGLVFYLPLWERGGGLVRDVVNGGLGTLGASALWNPDGSQIYSGVTASRITFGNNSVPATDVYLGARQQATFAVRFNGVSGNITGAMLARNDGNSTNVGWELNIQSNTTIRLLFERSGSNGSLISGTLSFVDGLFHTFIVSFDNFLKSGSMWLDGVPTPVTVAAGSGSQGSDVTRNLTVAGDASGFGAAFKGSIDFAAIWKDRFFTTEEAIAFSAEPYQFIKKSPYRQWGLVTSNQTLIPTAVASGANVPAPNIIGGQTIIPYNLPWILNPILAQ